MADIRFRDQLAIMIGEILAKDSRILDFGAGEGALTQRPYDMGYQVYSAGVVQEKFRA